MRISGIGVLWVASVAVWLQYGRGEERSPFADRPAISYSGKAGLDGKPLLWGQAPLSDYGTRMIEFNQDGLRSVRQVPGPGIHPRILFAPEDLPEIRRRLKETQCGRAAWKNLLCWTEMIKGQYDDQAEYAKPDVWNGGFGGLHGRVPLFRLTAPKAAGAPTYNHNQKAAELYQALAGGTATQLPPFYWNVFALEAFRCLIDDDKAGAELLAKVIVTAVKIDQGGRDLERAAKKAADPPEHPVGGYQLAFAYDFMFSWLTADQHRILHDELAATTWSHDNYGTFNEATSARSNWATFSYWLLEGLAIEGEEGFNDLKLRGMYRGWRNMLTYGWFQSGAVYEGEAKSQIGMDGVIPLAMRQTAYGFDNLAGHPYVRAYAMRFLPHSMNPMQTGFHAYDLLGGSHGRPMPMDTLGLKYMYPNDRQIDWLYRCAIGDDYENIPDRPDGYRNDLLFALVYASDFDPANNDPAKFELGNTFFCGERALMMTRSSWDKDAMMLNMHTRQANGGHPFSDRNAIMVAGAGRIWSPNGYASFRTCENSTICIDGQSQQETTPGRMVGFVDVPDATFAVGDAKYSWDWRWKRLDRSGDFYTLEDVRGGKVEIPPNFEPVTHSVNDFAYTKLPYAYLNVPIFESPSWIQPKGAISPVVREPNFPVRRAWRTAGLIRGDHPYALVIDDVQKDDTVHHYDWTLRLEYDIQIVSVAASDDGTMDIVLTGDDPEQAGNHPTDVLPAHRSAHAAIPAGQPMLLVKVLNRTGDTAAEPTVVELDNIENPGKYGNIRRLVIPADAVSPEFKVLLYAYRQGAALPESSWNKQHDAVTVRIGEQTDQIVFSPSAVGKTNIEIVRTAGFLRAATIVKVDAAITPFRDELEEARRADAAQTKEWVRTELADFSPAGLDGVIGYWDFESVSGGRVNNLLDPAAAGIEYPGAEAVGGRVGSGLKGSGGDALNLPGIDLSAFAGNGVTVAFWTRALEKKDGNFISCNGNRGISLGSEHQRSLRVDTDGQHRWQMVPIYLPGWHHIAWTYDGRMIRLYVDGAEVRASEAGNSLSFGKAFSIGNKFTGLLDELLIARRALTVAEIKKIIAVQTYGPGTSP